MPNRVTQYQNGISSYRGRFAPSPSGPLHEGSLVAALASYIDAKAHLGKWYVRIEDIDTPRVIKGADQIILHQLHALGMQWDGEVIYQSQRLERYQEIFDEVMAKGWIYGCACTRKEIADSIIHRALAETGQPLPDERPYQGTCRQGVPSGRLARAWRIRWPEQGLITFNDRWLGLQTQDVNQQVGDMIIKRADGLFAYQWVVVIDDHDQMISHIVRGSDLLSSTARQKLLCQMLGFTAPSTMHVPLVVDNTGRKISKQNHAPALQIEQPIEVLNLAWQRLGFEKVNAPNLDAFWKVATSQWQQRFL